MRIRNNASKGIPISIETEIVGREARRRTMSGGRRIGRGIGIGKNREIGIGIGKNREIGIGIIESAMGTERGIETEIEIEASEVRIARVIEGGIGMMETGEVVEADMRIERGAGMTIGIGREEENQKATAGEERGRAEGVKENQETSAEGGGEGVTLC